MALTIADMSVIIAAYTEERWEQLTALMRSLARQTVLPREVILVVDHNKPLLERVLAAYPGATIVENPNERGLSGARNAGIDIATGALIAMFDDDVVVAVDWIEHICEDLEDTRVLGAGGAAIPGWQRGRPRWFPREFDWVIGCSYIGMPKSKEPVRNLWGSNMCVRREVFEVVGLFSTELGRISRHPVGCEETELCVRALRRWPDRVFMYDPAAEVYHFVPPSRGKWSYFRSRCFYEGRSKALVVRLHGASRGLASERAYATRVLTRGVARGLRDALLHGDVTGLGRAWAIVAGFWLTFAGYVSGRLLRRRLARGPSGGSASTAASAPATLGSSGLHAVSAPAALVDQREAYMGPRRG